MLDASEPDILCVGQREEALGLTQSNASSHLSVLRAANLVQYRRAGGRSYYRLAAQADGMCQGVLAVLTEGFRRRVLAREPEDGAARRAS